VTSESGKLNATSTLTRSKLEFCKRG